MAVDREQWANSFLRYMGLPQSYRNQIVLICWQAAEGGPNGATWNPLNCVQPMPGSTFFNVLAPGIGVQNYVSQMSGLEATAKTIHGKNHGYEPILDGLTHSRRPRKTLAAVEASDWGTGGLAKSIVDDVKRHYAQYAYVNVPQ